VIEPAQKILKLKNGFYPGACILTSYFEGIMIYKHGEDSKDRSKQFFREGFVEVFMSSGSEPKTLEKIADEFYKEGRCGFFHDGMIRAKIVFAPEMDEALRATLPKVNGEIDMDGEIESILINPNEFLLYIEGHFNSFLNDLRNEANQELRDNFIKACELKWRLQDGPIVISD
jgi:hypothetical protein